MRKIFAGYFRILWFIKSFYFSKSSHKHFYIFFFAFWTGQVAINVVQLLYLGDFPFGIMRIQILNFFFFQFSWKLLRWHNLWMVPCHSPNRIRQKGEKNEKKDFHINPFSFLSIIFIYLEMKIYVNPFN